MANILLGKSYYDKRMNIKNKPSLSIRTIEVIEFLMEKEEIALGIAIEKLMIEDGLYMKILLEIAEDQEEIIENFEINEKNLQTI